MAIHLSDHFTFGKLLRYTLPSMIMMIFTSIYSIVDGLFVSNFVGKEPFAAVNLVYPVFMIIGSFGFMLGAGGSAIVAQSLGERKKQRANEYFSMLILLTFILGVVTTILIEIFLHPITHILGADGHLQEYCLQYGRQTVLTMPFFMLQSSFQMYFNVAEKPKLGLAVTVAAGITNIILDAVLVGALGMGLTGAALATNVAELIGGLTPVLYFMKKNSSLLNLVRAPFVGRVILKACTNGSSEMLSNISSSIVSILYNHQLLRFAGSDGVAAYGAIMYVAFIFAAIQIGYSSGSAPITAYHYGAQNTKELQNLLKKSLTIIGIFGLSMFSLAQLLAPVLTGFFVGYDAELYAMTSHGFRLYAVGFLFFGFTIYSSSFFTSLGDGAVSAAISFLRTLVFQVIMIFLMPALFGLNGIWLATATAEMLALVVAVTFWIRKRPVYQYY